MTYSSGSYSTTPYSAGNNDSGSEAIQLSVSFPVTLDFDPDAERTGTGDTGNGNRVTLAYSCGVTVTHATGPGEAPPTGPTIWTPEPPIVGN